MTDTETLALCHADNVPVRMLNALKEAGAPLEWSRGDNGDWTFRCITAEDITLDDLDGLLGKCVRVLAETHGHFRIWSEGEPEFYCQIYRRTQRFPGPTPYHAAVAALEAVNKEAK